MHHWAQIRSVRHRMKNHNPAGYYCLTVKLRRRMTFDCAIRQSYIQPTQCGVSQAGATKPGVPPFVSFPYVVADGSVTPGQYSSFLGKTHDRSFFKATPIVRLWLARAFPARRYQSRTFGERKELMRLIDAQSKLAEVNLDARGVNEFQEQAFSILTSPGFQRAFRLDQESSALRDKYGVPRMVSRVSWRGDSWNGVRFVTVYFSKSIGGNGSGGWDTHQKNFTELKDRLLPITDTTVPR